MPATTLVWSWTTRCTRSMPLLSICVWRHFRGLRISRARPPYAPLPPLTCPVDRRVFACILDDLTQRADCRYLPLLLTLPDHRAGRFASVFAFFPGAAHVFLV